MLDPGPLHGRGHARNHGGFRVLDQNASSLREDLARSLRAVVSHAGKHDADSLVTEQASCGAEELVDRGNVVRASLGRNDSDRRAAVGWNELDATASWADVRVSASESLVGFGL